MSGFSVLVVCTGNVCRSPAVERLLAAGLGPGSAVRVGSAGTGALVGEGVDPVTAGLLAEHGASAAGFTARQLTPDLVRGADLVLTATRAHRSRVVADDPAALRRTFTVRQLARLVATEDGAPAPSGGEVERWAALLPLAASRRHRVAAAPEDDDLADPYRRPVEVHRAVMAHLVPAVASLLAAVGAAAPREGHRGG